MHRLNQLTEWRWPIIIKAFLTEVLVLNLKSANLEKEEREWLVCVFE